MRLWYIAVGLDRGYFDTEYSYEFKLHTRFISNYLSKGIRKFKFETDGTFNMVSVKVTPQRPRECALVPIDVLEAEVSFDQARYEKIKKTTDCEYYLERLEEGFRKASKCKEIPLQILLDLIEEFRKNGCKNEWLHKKKRFKEIDIEVALNCFFTTWDFKLIATVNRISTKEQLSTGLILRTDPDEICFDKEFKDVLLDDENIVITDFLDRPRFSINLDKVLAGKFDFERLPTS
jgi:hypothetical protein